ncbi:amino acid permease (plasmid) [Entomospira entomophila]|uniref:Amino acid permease n=1 Tax=Entomospira entomophila TaxID=2719988 RepID=A0A968GEA9_9SPIO|nr:amino acid permease [Entomospira entomophilus]NIZ41469.1 amino acid permease [Entomospira entomophilus]WDI36303.1 amino acid permease [Entomospira entomophilus]
MNAKSQQQIVWTTLAMMSFSMVWGFGNVVNNFAEQGMVVIFSWVVIMAIYFVPYALMVGEMGSAYPDAKGGVGSWLSQATWGNANTGRLIAYLAGWTYWVVHVPYLAQKPQAALVALGWATKWMNADGMSFMTFLSPLTIQLIVLAIFLVFMYVASRGITSLKTIGYLAGMSTFVLSFLFVFLAIMAPAIRNVPIATENLFQVKNFIPHFNREYLGTIAMLVFAVGGAEKISPYVRNMDNPAKGFPKAMIALAVLVGLSAITGSIAMGMMFDANNMSADMLMNGAYDAFLRLGQHYGIGSTLLIIYAVATFVAQISVLMFSIDAPLKVMLMDADTKYVPVALTKTNQHGAPVNGYIMTAILVGLLIIVPALGMKQMGELYNWLLRLNSVVMPMRYMWVFFAYVILRNALNEERSRGAGYRFIKNSTLAKAVGWWALGFTAVACIMGAIPKGTPETNELYHFQLILNIIFPMILIGLGFVMPLFARRSAKA